MEAECQELDRATPHSLWGIPHHITEPTASQVFSYVIAVVTVTLLYIVWLLPLTSTLFLKTNTNNKTKPKTNQEQQNKNKQNNNKTKKLNLISANFRGSCHEVGGDSAEVKGQDIPVIVGIGS